MEFYERGVAFRCWGGGAGVGWVTAQLFFYDMELKVEMEIKLLWGEARNADVVPTQKN